MPAIALRAARDVGRGISGLAAAAILACAAHASDGVTLQPVANAPALPVATKSLEGAPLVIAADPSRVTLVHFFASWCEPCEEELPTLARYARDEAASVKLVGVAVAEPASRAKKFVARFDLPGEVANDPDKMVIAAFGVRGLPATVALAPDGRALIAAGPLDWTSAAVAETISKLKNKP